MWLGPGLCVGVSVEGGAYDWTTTDIEIRIKETHEDEALQTKRGVIRSVSVSLVFT